MQKFTAMLGLVAVVASALFVSCAQKKEPDLVAAFPKHHYATYAVNSKGVLDWSWDTSLYSFSQAKGVGFVKSVQDASILDFRVTPNADWTMSIVEGEEYVDLRTGYGYGFGKCVFTLSPSAYSFILRWLECRCCIFVGADAIIARHRKIESGVAVARVCHLARLYPFFQSSQSRVVAQPA